jgi:hypothetical protein
MRKGVVAILLLSWLGLNCPAWEDFRENEVPSVKAARSGSLPDPCYVSVSANIRQLDGTETTCSGIVLSSVSQVVDCRSVALIDSPQVPTSCHSLQSQYVLLRL